VKKSTNTWITAIVVLILFAAIFYFGYVMRGVWNPLSVPIHDTIIKVDTITHHITSHYPYYIIKTDTIIIRDTLPAIIDTAAILRNYYAWHNYTRTWQDSLLSVSLTDVISENKVFDSDFSYKILRPQEIVNNTNISYTYTKYLYIGGNITIPDAKWSSLAVFFGSNKLLYGIGYIPYQKGVSGTIAFKVASFK